ncbi:hypothetical protein MLD38_029670 [Melastoma candidum]|uniref:Uncharacterized protein n=1 Tax=Melastoma candidum TaxID=119954 RepID=A0ACB9N4F1_9MYRT|nr:hypothetical protein MLD38_029670 [Melastoma candidum]
MREKDSGSGRSPTLNRKVVASAANRDIPKSAKSKLYEVCASRHWKPPSFDCCIVRGPIHCRKFGYKVSVAVEGKEAVIVECFGELRPAKKAAAEQAAEGVLWYLKHLGYAT